MKKVLLGIVAVILLAVVGVVGAAAMQPDEFHMERSATFAASPADLHTFSVDYKLMQAWSPWKDLDPDAVYTFSDPPAGADAWYSWKGNDEVGEGKMSIVSIADDKVVHKLEFFAPFQSQAETSILIADAGEGQSKLTWTYDQVDLDLMTKAMYMFMDMDSMLGGNYEDGLAMLKQPVEAAAVERVAAEAKAAEEKAAADAAAAASGKDATAKTATGPRTMKKASGTTETGGRKLNR